jgi:hypothetical protein
MFRNGVVVVGDILALAELKVRHCCITYNSLWPLVVKVDHLFRLQVLSVLNISTFMNLVKLYLFNMKACLQ